MKKIIVFVMFFQIVMFIQAKKVATLVELSRPDTMVVGNNYIYITEHTSIFIYSTKDFHLIKKFGKEGEGPQEFKVVPFSQMSAFQFVDKVYISSFAKLSVFSKDGEFIKESRIPPYSVFKPIGDMFVGTSTTANKKKQSVVSVNLYNANFEKVKELYISDLQVGTSFTLEFPVNAFDFSPRKDKIYITAGKEGFVIDVFDLKGTKLYRIKKDYKPIKVDEKYKKSTLKWFKTNKFYKQYWEFMKKRISFKTYYPPIKDAFVTGDRIYVLTYETQGEKTECIIMDLQGNEQKREFLPCPATGYPPKYDFHSRRFYSLVENLDEENWELHMTEIK